MGAISDFLAAFRRDCHKYLAVEKEFSIYCERALRAEGIDFLWQSRVKATESLETKLRDRNKEYKNEAENVADIKDLVAGRIILARWLDFERVKNIVNEKFNVKDQAQHPKNGKSSVTSKTRFRGYDGYHFHVTQRTLPIQEFGNLVIEIQVMSAFMWGFSTLEHDIQYKRLHGEPSEDLVLSLEQLKGIANLGEIGLEMFDRHLVPVARLSPQQSHIDPNLPTMIRTTVAKVGLDENDRQCLLDLGSELTDPRDDRIRIEASKDGLLEGLCSWVLKDPAFVDWWTYDELRLLWIHGDPGKGKTMMMMAIIDEVSKRLQDQPGSNVLAYFFCQDTNSKLNTTVSVLRGLIFQLVDQEKTLIRHVREKYDSAGARLFRDENALFALQEVLSNILKDQSLGNVYFMVDALDECDAEIYDLLKWIIRTNSEISPKIKWLTTSRNQPASLERLARGHKLRKTIELNSLHVAPAVAGFIDHKVKELAESMLYSSELQVSVRKSLLEKAEDTFLWVALVCQELRQKDVLPYRVESFLEKVPTGLVPLYERMLNQILHQKDEDAVEPCRRVLCTVALASRPLNLKEIAFFSQISAGTHELVSFCGSFITIRQDIAYLVHQSAKDFLCDRSGNAKIFSSGQEHEHAITASLCLNAMSSNLKQDVCNLNDPGRYLSNINKIRIDTYISSHVQYACLYWVEHLQQAGSSEQERLILRGDCKVYEFFQCHFLHWLEALSLLGNVSEAVLAINSLYTTHTVGDPEQVFFLFFFLVADFMNTSYREILECINS